MTIDKSIENLVLLKKLEDNIISGKTNSVLSQSLDCAISTMQKYQKIQKIARWNNAPSPYYKPDGQLFREICEVFEDGTN